MTMKLQILGTGCAKCRLLAEHAERAASELGLDYEIEKVTKIDEILAFGVMATPALAIDGEVVIFGHVPTTGRLKKLLVGVGVARP